jgi:hypothetical protein
LVRCKSAVAHCGDDNAPTVLQVFKVTDNVYTLIEPTANGDPEPPGNNANFGVIAIEDGVVQIDPGAMYIPCSTDSRCGTFDYRSSGTDKR